jgi:hypothetical protein
MSRYHINPETGEPLPCVAKARCLYGDLETAHYGTKEAARAAYEILKKDEEFAILRQADQLLLFVLTMKKVFFK